jgi:hypothetical protein
MSQHITDKLEILSKKIEESLNERNALKEEIKYYQAENRELKSSLSKSKTGTKNFPVPPESPNIAIGKERYAERIAAIVKQIDGYVEEIDKCVAQLG